MTFRRRRTGEQLPASFSASLCGSTTSEPWPGLTGRHVGWIRITNSATTRSTSGKNFRANDGLTCTPPPTHDDVGTYTDNNNEVSTRMSTNHLRDGTQCVDGQ